jgi:hypothetical protein
MIGRPGDLRDASTNPALLKADINPVKPSDPDIRRPLFDRISFNNPRTMLLCDCTVGDYLWVPWRALTLTFKFTPHQHD